MDLYIGMRIVSFGTFMLGVSTFTLCGWTYMSNSLTNEEFESYGCDKRTDDNETNNGTSPELEEAFVTFKSVIFHATAVVMIATVVQIITGAIILGSALQGCRERTKIWFALNLGVNLILLLCPVMTLMYAQELEKQYPTCFNELRSQIQHLDAYYLGVSIDFIVQFHALVACLLMLRYDRGREYHLVEMI